MADEQDAARWLRRVDELAAMEDGEGDAVELVAEELKLLREVHSEDVETDFLHRLWTASGSWAELRHKESLLRAMAVEHAAAARGQARNDLNFELLRPPFVPELPSEISSAMASAIASSKPVEIEADPALKKATQDAYQYIQEREEEHMGFNLWLDSNGNLETVLPATSGGTDLKAPVATLPSDNLCIEALCKVTCSGKLCKHPRGLCWHCWRIEDSGEEHPDELRDLLSYARTVAETAAPLQRAAETAYRWTFLEDISSATVEALKGSASGSGLLVLGGVGISAVRAAKECGAKVWIWEPRKFLAATARAVVAENGVGNGSIEVIEGGLAELEEKVAFSEVSLIVAEGLEMDGLLGFGVLKQLRAVKGLMSRLASADQKSVNVLPSSLTVSVQLADARVAKVSKFDFSAFARVSKAFAPFLSAAATNATSAKPRPLTEELEAFQIDLNKLTEASPTSSGLGWEWPDNELEERTLSLTSLATAGEGSMASCVLVKFGGSLGNSENRSWGDSIYYVPPVSTPETGAVLRCFRNSAKIWFEVGSKEVQATPSQMPLHGPPFGHAYLQEWYLDMYRDVDRNDFYEEGLRRWVQKYRKQNGATGPCGRVMDIGSGTGLLLFFAMRAGAAQTVGVEVAPNLKRMSEALYEANSRCGNLPKEEGCFKVIHNDALRLELPEAERPHCLVTEMMDGSGLGENMVRVILHAKAKLLAKGAESQIVPRKLTIKAALLNIRLPVIGGVSLSPLEAFWGPTRALGCEGEFANVDLDNPEAGACDVVSDVVQVWDVDFAKSAEEIAEALRSHMVEFPLLTDPELGTTLTVNAVSWWFEAHLDDAEEGEDPPSILTNVPIRLRHKVKTQGNPGGGTHWHQAVSVIGPFERKPGDTFSLKAHTDGKKITWTSKEQIAMSESIEKIDALREAWLEAARKAEEQAQMGVWQRQRMAEDVGDTPRVAALQAAAMHVGSQPGLFGVFGGASVASHILKEWFGAGCSAGF